MTASPKLPRSPLYPIVDVDLCRMRGLDAKAVAAAFLAGGARILQIRQKSGGSAELLDTVRHAVAAAAPAQAAVIVNDRADISAIAGAHGVHVGQTDLTPQQARAIAGSEAMVGLSTHTPEQVDAALRSTADYIAVGPVFRTATKETGYTPRGLDLVRYASGRGKPVVAIGGVTLGNAAEVIAAGASAVAVISGLLDDGAPDACVRGFLARLPPSSFHV